MLTPGLLSVRLDKPREDFSGEIMHLGGWLIINPDNTCEINLFDGVEKNEVKADRLGQGEFAAVEDDKGGAWVKKIRDSAQNTFAKKLVN